MNMPALFFVLCLCYTCPMLPEKSLVIYKNRPAIITGREGDKINIKAIQGEDFKVREKDITLIHQGPCSAKDLEISLPEANVRETWELLADDENTVPISLKELAELLYDDFSPRTAWAAWELLRDACYFSGDISSIRPRPRTAVEEDEKKRQEKEQEAGDRAAFLEKLKKLPSFGGPLSSADRRFLQDVEALARGLSSKSRTIKDLGKSETPEEAHRLLLNSGVWTVWVNPHPGRFGLDGSSARIIPPPPPEEERLDLTGLAAYAIDNRWSNDPDDAISLEISGEYTTLWVHVADPASSIPPGSPADIEARGRGATLYLPEGPARMLCPEALSLFALGSGRRPGSEISPALSFKIVHNHDHTIKEVDIIPSLVKVKRITYEEADALIALVPSGQGDKAGEDGKTLAALAALAERNMERRLNAGAVIIDLPETQIHVNLGEKKHISIEPVPPYRSMGLVRECMILAGEGAARWALQRKLAFPFIGQEAGELPGRPLEGFAGAWQLRRCMRPRNLSTKPAAHWGLGLDEYAQVTSPLRRYMDLLCHQQIRAWLNRDKGQGEEPLGVEEVLFRSGAAEAAASAVNRTEKASRAHWMAVYLSAKKDSDGHAETWEAVVLERKGSKGTVIIPALGLETQVNLRGHEAPNEQISLNLSSVKIPEGEASFVLAD